MLSLYLHIPFCRHRCSYCDFNTYTSLDGLREAYTAALCAEIKQVGGGDGRLHPVHTIFFGGGTPSLMSVGQLQAIMQAVRAHFDLSPTAEISLEANPGTVNEAYLGQLRELGFNRLSFGVQSAVASELALLEREHDFAAAVTAVAAARAAGFDNLSLDLIYGVPGQTLASWRESVEAVLALRPEHLSLYCLTIEPGTPMQRWLHNGRFSPPDPDLAADQYELAGQLLAAAGFIQYEISNWAQPGRECEHNLTYWRNGEYLGLGAGAHGHAAGTRYQVVKQPRVYIRRLSEPGDWRYPWSTAVASHHQLDRAEAMTDTVITQLRLLREGLDLAQFADKFGQSLASAFPDALPQLLEWGLLHEQNGRLLLTERGRFLSNQVFYRFM
jgi:oxygen-independent coproporphyrinogen III oxidase